MSLDFRLFGIGVRVRVWFILVGMFIGMNTPQIERHPWMLAVWIGIVFFGVLSHELGHALVGRAFGWKPSIELVALGGLTRFEGIEGARPWQRMLMVASGPTVNAAFGALCLVVYAVFGAKLGPLAAETLEYAGWLQLAWAFLNLLPMLPLDGGQLLLEGARWIAPERGPRVAGGVMLIVVGAIVLFTLRQPEPNLFLLFIALLSGVAAYRLARDGTLALGEEGRTPREQAHFALARRDGKRLVTLAGKLVSAASSVEELDEAFYLLAWGRLFAGEPAEAKKAASAITAAHPSTHALEGAIALELGDPDEALVQFEKVLPRLNPWLEDYIVRAILLSRRWDDARVLFEDELGREFTPPSLLAVMTAARADGALEAAEGMRTVLARKMPVTAPA